MSRRLHGSRSDVNRKTLVSGIFSSRFSPDCTGLLAPSPGAGEGWDGRKKGEGAHRQEPTPKTQWPCARVSQTLRIVTAARPGAGHWRTRFAGGVRPHSSIDLLHRHGSHPESERTI